MSKIHFKATNKQIAEMSANAINASTPIGLGVMHYDPSQQTKPEELMEHVSQSAGHIGFDYFQGRMVKLNFWKHGNGRWSVRDDVSTEYQSWVRKYPTIQDLLKSVGVEEFEIVVEE